LASARDWGDDDGGIAQVSRGRCRIFLTNRAFREQHGNAVPVLIWLNLDNRTEVDDLYEAWSRSDARIVSRPESKPWKLHEFTAADLDGNLFRVFYDFAWEQKRDKAPNFSGEWVLNRQACTLDPGADAMQSATVHIDHHEPAFHYKGEFVGPGGPVKVEYNLEADGREIVNTSPDLSIVSKLAWDADALVASWRIRRPDGEMTIRFRYELADAGRGLRADERLRSPERNQDNVWIFERRS
jgi:hypothetical protein